MAPARRGGRRLLRRDGARALSRPRRARHRRPRRGFLAERRGALQTVIERGIDRGDLRADLDIEPALDVLGGPLFYHLLVTGGPIDARNSRTASSTCSSAHSLRSDDIGSSRPRRLPIGRGGVEAKDRLLDRTSG
jgi:Tetracyclin repressor-like, C-terminal domain